MLKSRQEDEEEEGIYSKNHHHHVVPPIPIISVLPATRRGVDRASSMKHPSCQRKQEEEEVGHQSPHQGREGGVSMAVVETEYENSPVLPTTQPQQQQYYDTNNRNDDTEESHFQALFAEQTALEMQAIVDYWSNTLWTMDPRKNDVEVDDRHPDIGFGFHRHHHEPFPYPDEQSIALPGNALASYYYHHDDNNIIHDDNTRDVDDITDHRHSKDDVPLLDAGTSVSTTTPTSFKTSVVVSSRSPKNNNNTTLLQEDDHVSLYKDVFTNTMIVQEKPMLPVVPLLEQSSSSVIIPWRRRLRFQLYCFLSKCHDIMIFYLWERQGLSLPLSTLRYYLFLHCHSTPQLLQLCTTLMILTFVLAVIAATLTMHIQLWKFSIWIHRYNYSLFDYYSVSSIFHPHRPDDTVDPFAVICWEKLSPYFYLNHQQITNTPS